LSYLYFFPAKKEIPQFNYVMHTMHCARNITLCKNCKEGIPKNQFEEHSNMCKPKVVRKPSPPPTGLEKSPYYQVRKSVEDKKVEARRDRYIQKYDRLVDSGYSLQDSSPRYNRQNSFDRSSSVSSFSSSYRLPTSFSTSSIRQNGTSSVSTEAKKESVQNAATAVPEKKPEQKQSGLLACKYCELELPKLELDDHENYCGSRTDKCLECGELVMFKYKQIHMDSNHGFLKLKDEPGPRASWDSVTQRTSPIEPTRRRPQPFRSFIDFDYDPMPYLPSSYSVPGGGPPKKKEGESYKEISRRLDCPAPQPPAYRRRNPPTEIVIPCEFCGVPVPHEDLVEHETGCRPDLARFNPRRRSPEADDYFIAPQPSSPEVELPCEFCGDMILASQLLSHQLRCS
ncbi:hypothetical protein NQ318_016554, partial [Aromia moschata]